jgi:hypothetical protein
MLRYNQTSNTELERQCCTYTAWVVRWKPAQMQQSGVFVWSDPFQWFQFGSNPDPDPNRGFGTIANTRPPLSLYLCSFGSFDDTDQY